ncbi:hypothetical protein GN109_17235, partial [Collimonas pratensis]|uniref:thioesterase domain-containing protein n=1 Tax=Collimonas pratensis TaxID=279113 RepID=UPI001A025630
IGLIHLIRARLSINLPITVVFTAPTVAALATIIFCEDELHSLLVPLQLRGEGPPLFCVHPVGGQVFFYQELAQHLGEAFPIYGIQARESADVSGYDDDIRAMAAGYCAAIRALQPTGPYRLIGWSTGGLIALAVASALEAEGCEVSYLGLLDTHLGRQEDALTDEGLSWHAAMSTLSAITSKMFSPYEITAISDDLIEKKLTVTEFLSEENRHIALPLFEAWTGMSITEEVLAYVQQQFAVTRRHLSLLNHFLPSPIKGRLHVYWADSPSVSLTTLEHYRERVRQFDQPYHAESIDGDHYTMLKVPCVCSLGGKIVGHIDPKPVI